MTIKALLASATFALVVGMTSSASAESARIAAIRAGIQELDARSEAIRERIERSPPAVRRESQRIMAAVGRSSSALSTRLAIIDLVGGTADDGQPIQEMEATMTSAERLLSMVESWFSKR